MEIWYFLLYPLILVSAVLFLVVRFERTVVSELQAVVDAVVGQLSKVRDEIVGEVGLLREQIGAAGVSGEVDLSGLIAIADALDAIVPDAADEAEVEVEYEGLDFGDVDEPVEDKS